MSSPRRPVHRPDDQEALGGTPYARSASKLLHRLVDLFAQAGLIHFLPPPPPDPDLPPLQRTSDSCATGGRACLHRTRPDRPA
ncbi:hypothetical protein ACWC4C_04305 [Streptomyces olivaceoviridis]|uniref:hypothetical protein n=1 Tax=Streptomyces olivaceoviridis TaxID=1921 RepID=UPI00369B5F4D